MKVKNVSGTARELTATGTVVEDGAVIEVSKELGESLCDQPGNWKAVKAEKKGDD